jgi:hypothetical protein
MVEPTPIRKRVHRDRRTKMAAVVLAEIVGVTEAEKQTGIPKQSIQYWLDRPEFRPYRTRAREDLIAEITTVVHLAWTKIGEGLMNGEFEPRERIAAAEKATQFMQLLSGGATERVETLTSGMDDHERAQLRTILKAAIAEREAANVGD